MLSRTGSGISSWKARSFAFSSVSGRTALATARVWRPVEAAMVGNSAVGGGREIPFYWTTRPCPPGIRPLPTVPFGAMRVYSKKNSMVLANILYDTVENYNLASTFSRWNEVDLPLIAPAASPRSCGRCLRVIKNIRTQLFEITPAAGCARYIEAATKVRFSSL